MNYINGSMASDNENYQQARLLSTAWTCIGWFCNGWKDLLNDNEWPDKYNYDDPELEKINNRFGDGWSDE